MPNLFTDWAKMLNKKGGKTSCRAKSVCFTAILNHKILVIQSVWFQIEPPRTLGKALVGKKCTGLAGTADLGQVIAIVLLDKLKR